jgi:hypothetical protein
MRSTTILKESFIVSNLRHMKLIKDISRELAMVIATVLYQTGVTGFILYKFYYWFVVNMLPHPPVYKYAQFLGIALILKFIVGPEDAAIETIGDLTIEKNFNWPAFFLYSWIIFLVGWLIHVTVN